MKTPLPNIFCTALAAVAVTAAAVGLEGCASSEKFLRTDPAEIVAPAVPPDKIHVGVDSSSSWIVDVMDKKDWVSYEYVEDNPASFWVDLEPNESLEERTDSIYIASGDGLSLIVPLRQSAMDVRFDVTPAQWDSFGARETATRTLTVSTTLSTWGHSLLYDADWIDVKRGEGDQSNILTVGVKSSRSLDERRDTIVVSPVNEAFLTLADSIAVRQDGIALLVDSPSMNQATFDIEIPAARQEVVLTVYSKAPWTVSPDAPAERAALDTTGGGSDVENGVPVVMTVAENTTEEEYTFTLTFESGGETYEYLCRQQSNRPEQETQPEEEEGI